jgi:multicomponent Na+:H+ antiporter subunit D
VNLLSLPVLVPLLAGALLLAVRGRVARVVVASVAASVTLAATIAIATRALAGDVLTLQMADWAAPFGITLVADGLSALLLVLSAFFGLLTVPYLASSLHATPGRTERVLVDGGWRNRARDALGAQALLQFLFMGVHMSLLTGDLFNLFVAFEVMLIASYGLLLLGTELPQLREGFKYVIVNLVASAVFVSAAGMTYGLVGTLYLADIGQRVAAHGPDVRLTVLAAMLGLVFAVKSALFPLGFWLPNAYPTPPAGIGAYFAAVLTKVGVYALVRAFALMFPGEEGLKSVLLALAGLTMLVGALGFLSRQRWRHAMAFGNVASIGYLVAALFAGSEHGVAVGVFYLITSVAVVFTLFALAGIAERIAGPWYRASGHLGAYPWLGAGFFVAALTLVGTPPSSGFLGKYGLVQALLNEGGAVAVGVVVAAVVASFVLLYGAMQIWETFFWGDSDAVHHVATPRTMSAVSAVAVVAVVALAVFGGPLYRVSERVAGQLVDHAAYREAVLAPAPGPRLGGE